MQQSSAVSETPASGAGPERRPPFPWASCPLCSRSELPPDGEHRTESLGPCGPRTDVHCVVFLGLDQLKYLLTTSCAPSPALGLQTQTGIPWSLFWEAAKPQHRERPHPGTTSIHRASGSKHIASQRSKGRSPRSGPAPRHPALCSTFTTHESDPRYPRSSAHRLQLWGPLHGVCCLAKKFLRLNPLRGEARRLWSWR